MSRTPRKKENKKVIIIEDVKEPESEWESSTEDPKNDAYYYSKDKTPEPEPAETEQHPSTDEEIEIPKKKPKQRSEKQLEQLRLAREITIK